MLGFTAERGGGGAIAGQDLDGDRKLMSGQCPTTEQAVSASVACARALGLPCDNPEVIADGYSVRVRLHPAPVVTRVITDGLALRGAQRPWMQREVAVVQFLFAAGAPVVPAWENPGPHVAEGLPVSLWRWVDHEPGGLAQPAFGALLGELHRALATYSTDLPLLVGPLTDIATALAVSAEPVLHRSAEHLVPLAQSWPRRPLHGDAHTGNVLLTPDGPKWTDVEDVCAGPSEWDLASMTITDEAVASYPGIIDPARLQDCRDLRRLQVLASLVVQDDYHTALYDELVAGLSSRPWMIG
jgi:hypothetical protein